MRLHGVSGGSGTMKRVPCATWRHVQNLHLPTRALVSPNSSQTQPGHLNGGGAAEHSSATPRWTNMFSLQCLPERRRLRREAGRAGWEDCIVSHKKGGKGGMAGAAAALGTHRRLHKLPNEATFSLFSPLSSSSSSWRGPWCHVQGSA
ncbi:hypothetical protein E2C01_057320 [Portunus trituberculatus]|uniref:Uncharacterized protein n=1 Tax=Portunus trituberculatus TaxID=210409 RepID=A0A5B7H062_PORTR|nr:hypothetical protein [Portunus trituberculatus]